MKRDRKKLLVISLALLSIFGFSGSREAYGIGHQLVAEKSYLAKTDNEKDTFSAELSVPDDSKSSPVWITFYNGYGKNPGFSWIKVTMAPKEKVAAKTDGSEAAKDTEEKPEVLVDEHTFLKTHAKSIDLSGYFADGPRKIKIEGSGNKGSYFAWVLTTAPSILTLFNATTVTPGKNFMIHGAGFGTDPDKISATVQDQDSKVISVKNGIMVARAPEKLEGDCVVLRVKKGEKLSNQLSILTDYVPPHLISMSPKGGNTGATVTVRGSNFSRVPEENIVRIGPNVAPVLKVMDSETMVCRIPDLGINTDTLPLTVTTNGRKSDNYLNFWCGDNFF